MLAHGDAISTPGLHLSRNRQHVSKLQKKGSDSGDHDANMISIGVSLIPSSSWSRIVK